MNDNEIDLPTYATAPGTRVTNEHGDVVRQPLEHRDYSSPDAVPFTADQLAERAAMAARFAAKRK